MEKSDYDSLEEWDVVTVSQVLETGTLNKEQDKSTDATTVVTDDKNGLKSPAEEESPIATPDVVPSEPKNAPVAQPEDETKAILEQCDEEEPRSESESQGEQSKASSPEPESQILADTADESKSEDIAVNESEIDSKISVNIEKEKSASPEKENTPETIQHDTVQDIVCNITEHESSPADIETDVDYILDHHIKNVLGQNLAAIDSSSSDIDIIDEVMDESAISTSLMSCPLSLSISSSVATADTSSTSQFVDIKHYNQEQKEEPKQVNTGGREHKERVKSKGLDYPGTSSSQLRSKRSPSPRKKDSQQSRRTTHWKFYDWLVLFLEFLRNMSFSNFCLIGTGVVAFYLTVIYNQTNIFAFIQKDDAMSQMKHMVEELRHDNKILKEQMLAEIKNEKAFSSFEHQIKELRKENSRLNHMLFDVAKVLDKQKDFPEKKETEYLLAPFKKEINKLKEYINVLKIDNEELQKEMVRMRYSDSHPKEKEMPVKEEIQLDVESLKKWNELITLLSKELGLLAEGDNLKGQSFGKDSKPFWKDLLNNLRKSLSNENLSKVFSEYKELKKKVMSDLSFLVKDFFTPKENPSAEKCDFQWRNIGDFIEDLKEKWTNIKDRLYTSDLKKFFERGWKKSETPLREEHQTTTEQVKIRTTYDRQGSQSKPDSAEIDDENTVWVFERAADREQQRDDANEKEANWFLKKGRHDSEDKGNKRL